MPNVFLPQGLEICYETFGRAENPTVLLMHGLGSQLLLWEDAFCEELVEAGFHVIRYDHRDSGLSSTMDSPYDLSDMALDAKSLLAYLDVERAHIVGFSLGGMVAQVFASEHPQNTLSLISMASNTGEKGFGDLPKGEVLEALLAPSPENPNERAAKDLADRRLWASPKWHDDQHCLKVFKKYAERSCKPAEAQERQMSSIFLTGNRKAKLSKIKTPTLVLHGNADTLIDFSGGKRTAEVIPNAKLVIIDGWGHDLPPGSWPEIVEEILKHIRHAGSLKS